ncbi:MAG: hypothetical protein JW882_14275 [Deltaproteobacteria bacterium]|nr:hypothetical protein [Deltaproteobacteria bacterium]
MAAGGQDRFRKATPPRWFPRREALEGGVAAKPRATTMKKNKTPYSIKDHELT